MNRPKVIDVAAALIVRGGKLLITKRRFGDHLGELWEFPGGKREAGETFESCLARELFEEVGIVAQPIEVMDIVEHEYAQKSVRIKFIRCRLEDGEPQPFECEALAWITRDQIDQYDFPSADRRVIETLKANPEFWV